MDTLSSLTNSRRIVIKVGSALLVDPERGTLRRDWLAALCKDIASAKQNGVDLAVVSSGAIALGKAHLGLLEQKLTLTQKQACAAIGQSQLTAAYREALADHGLRSAQALFTIQDTEDRRRWLNARSTLEALFRFETVPIINENDTIATDEIRYGDNDRLAARSAQMVSADTLILLSDIDGLYSADPRADAKAAHIPLVEKLTAEIMAMGGEANARSGVGTGGMATKLLAARIATEAGCNMCIMDGYDDAPLARLKSGAKCTWFVAGTNPALARKQWIGGSLKCFGELTIDDGAMKALQNGKSLLAAGVSAVIGEFGKGDAVKIQSQDGVTIAQGLTSYGRQEIELILGKKSDQFIEILGYSNGNAVIHRDNLVLRSEISSHG